MALVEQFMTAPQAKKIDNATNRKTYMAKHNRRMNGGGKDMAKKCKVSSKSTKNEKKLD